MPQKPTAIKLKYQNIDKISVSLGIDSDVILDELGFAQKAGQTIYYVKNCLYLSYQMPHMIYTEPEFLIDFASMPEGIEDDFVPVTQVRG